MVQSGIDKLYMDGEINGIQLDTSELIQVLEREV